MAEEAEVKSLKLPTFDGAHKKFQLWWVWFTAYATVYRFIQALTIGGEMTLTGLTENTVIDTSTDIGKEQEAAKKRNALAMANLLMAFTSDTTMSLIWKAKTKDWPSGLAHLVVTSLFRKYQPQDTITRVELRRMLNGVKMKKGEDPVTLFKQLRNIENRYNTATQTLEEDNMIAVVLGAATSEYQSIVTAKQRRLGGNITLDNLEECMNQYWRQVSARENNESNDEETELTLTAFSGRCYNCGEDGHKATDCKKPNRKGNNNRSQKSKKYGKKTSKKCHNCGKPGHLAYDCWEKEENKNIRPSGWQSSRSGEQGMAAVDGNRCEILLSSMTFPKKQALLSDRNIWIGDTSAMQHMTLCKDGMTNVKRATSEDKVTVGNGSIEKTTEIGDLPGVICNQNGKKLAKTILKDVAIVPSSKYNLFSLTKAIKDGWELSG
jgi:hypothetical protein